LHTKTLRKATAATPAQNHFIAGAYINHQKKLA
jgi:hypothetical protein